MNHTTPTTVILNSKLYHIIMHPIFTNRRFLFSLGLLPSSSFQRPFEHLRNIPFARIQQYTQFFENHIKDCPTNIQAGIVTCLEEKKCSLIHNPFQHGYLEVVAYRDKDDYRRGESEVRLVIDRSILEVNRTPKFLFLLVKLIGGLIITIGRGNQHGPFANIKILKQFLECFAKYFGKCSSQHFVKLHFKLLRPLVKSLIEVEHSHIRSL